MVGLLRFNSFLPVPLNEYPVTTSDNVVTALHPPPNRISRFFTSVNVTDDKRDVYYYPGRSPMGSALSDEGTLLVNERFVIPLALSCSYSISGLTGSTRKVERNNTKLSFSKTETSDLVN